MGLPVLHRSLTEAAAVGTAPGPAAPATRIQYVDALRGVALLGILIANVRQMHWPFGVANWPLWNTTGETLAWWDWAFFDALVELKFITLFSLLFGASFALQRERTPLPARQFRAIYLRRLAILALFGIAHGLLLYSAEVLLAYAVIGLFLFVLNRYSSDALLRAGIALLAVSVLWSYIFGYLVVGKSLIAIVVATALLLTLTTFLLRR